MRTLAIALACVVVWSATGWAYQEPIDEERAKFESVAAGVRTASIQDQVFASSYSAELVPDIVGEETDQFADLMAAVVAFQKGKRAANRLQGLAGDGKGQFEH